jgi:hypothetical protein
MTPNRCITTRAPPPFDRSRTLAAGVSFLATLESSPLARKHARSSEAWDILIEFRLPEEFGEE